MHLKKASEQNSGKANNLLGYVYQVGYPGVEKDKNTALKYYKLAKEQNYPGSEKEVKKLERQLKRAEEQQPQ